MKWFFNLEIKKRALICGIPLYISIFFFIIDAPLVGAIFLALLVPSLFLLAYSEKKDKEKTEFEKSSTFTNSAPKVSCPIEAFQYDLLGTEGKNGRSYRKTLARHIYWKDGEFHFPYPTIVTLQETQNSYDVLVNDQKIGETRQEDFSFIKTNYDRIYNLSIDVEHDKDSKDSDYIPSLNIKYYTADKYRTLSDYTYSPRGQRVSKMFNPVFLNEYIVIDIETTGIDRLYNDILEVAALHIKDGEIIDTFSELCFSDKISAESFSVNHISKEMVQTCRKCPEVLKDFSTFIGDLPLIGHNIDYDLSFICSIHPITNQFDDTCILADEFLMGKRGGSIRIENRKLPTVCKALGVQQDTTHRALGDCTSTYLCYEKIKQYIRSITNS